MTKFTAPNVPELDASKFGWTKNPDPKGGYLGVAEASDFGPLSNRSLFGRCYRDAIDVGCILFNNKRETTMQFVLEQVAENEGDVQFWALTNCDEFDPIKLIIYND